MQEQDVDPASLLNWYRRLLALRQQRPELRHGTQTILCDDAGKLLCLLREADGQRSLLIANLGDGAATPAIDAVLADAAWIDLLDEHHGKAAPDHALPPLGLRLLGSPTPGH